MKGIEPTLYQRKAAAQILQAFDVPFIPQMPNMSPIFSLAAPTGAGKTVIAIHLIEELFRGEVAFVNAHPNLRVLWVSQSPELNEQTRQRFLTFCEETGQDDLYIIEDSTFNESVFPAGKIGFINTQKLSKTGLLDKYTDSRDSTFWDVFNRTAQDHYDDFLVIIDEAHQGSRELKPAELTRLQQLLNPEDPKSPATFHAKTLGISATSRRFRNIVNKTGRNLIRINVPPREVRETGLMKDRILSTLDGDFNALLSGAVEKYQEIEDRWSTYAQNNPQDAVVKPLLCVQVKDRSPDGSEISESNLDEIVTTLIDYGFSGESIRHVFGEHITNKIADINIDYIRPSNIQADVSVRVVLFKQSIIEGWDCPRAEILISDRSSSEYTVVAQLIGRVLRSPLHRRIEQDILLNDVYLYLPHFNEDTVQDVLNQIRGEFEGEVTRSRLTVELPLKVQYTDAWKKINTLTTFNLSRAPVSTPAIIRLNKALNRMALASPLVNIIEYHNSILGHLLDYQNRRLSEGYQPYCGEKIDYIRMEVDTLEGLFVQSESESLSPSESTFRRIHSANKILIPERICRRFYKQNQGETVHNIVELSRLLADLFSHDEFGEVSRTFADEMIDELANLYSENSEFHTLPESARIEVERYLLLYTLPRETRLNVPNPMQIALGPTSVKNHLFGEGNIARLDLSDYELRYLEHYRSHLDNAHETCWYRNPTNQQSGLRIPYRDEDFADPFVEGTRSGKYPDMLFLRRVGSEYVVDILEPHGSHLEDWMHVAHGFSYFAEKYGSEYGRIILATTMGSDVDFLEFDFNNPIVRETVRNATSQQEFLEKAPSL